MSLGRKWTELEIMLSEINQTQKDKYVFSPTWNIDFFKNERSTT
jgi:hypothetical protein